MPSGTFELVVNLREDEFRIFDPTRPDIWTRFSGAMVSGAYRRTFAIDARQHASVIGVHFRPGGAFPFLGAGAEELTDRHVDLDSLWGNAAVELRERLCAAKEPAERFRLLEKALLSFLVRPTESHYAVRFALGIFTHSDSSMQIREIAKQAGLSQRRFIEVFSKEVGLTPKLFCRLQRFQRAFSSLRQSPTPDWMQLIVDCGYFDQSHFIHEFQGFSGLQPSEFIARRSRDVMENHIPLSTG